MTLKSLKLLSPAKLNLFLHITGRRPDGYHNLQTLFQLLDYGDDMEFSVRADNQITLTPELPGVAFEDNLIIKAARKLQTYRKLGVDIVLSKRLPMGGGIGGGSSNAATCLVALNYLWQLNLSTYELQKIGVSLGADVPVFVQAQTAWAEGVGDLLQPIELEEKYYLVLQPKSQVSTAAIFSHKDLTRGTAPIKVAAFLEQGGRNDCQDLVRKLYPPVDKTLTWLAAQNATARMTGTGACVFAEYSDAATAEQLLKEALNLDSVNSGFVAKGVNRSSLFALLPDHEKTCS